MRGYLCDVCATFMKGSPKASYQHSVLFDGGEGEQPYRRDVDAHFCDDCAIDLSRGWGLIEGEIESGADTNDQA